MNEVNANTKERSLKERIDEIVRGYNNAQELICFMDSKLAIIWGFCAAVLAYCAPISIELCKKIGNDAINIHSLGIVTIISIFAVCTVIAFWATINGIFGRKEQGVTTPLPHILFPIENKTDIHQFKIKLLQRTEEDEYNEVCDQIYSVGKILEIKLDRSRMASYCLNAQVIAGILILILGKL